MEANHWIEDWLSARAEAPKTKELYLMCWKHFTEFCKERGKDPLRIVDDYRVVKYQGEAQGKFLDEWQDILNAFNTWLKPKYAPLTMKNHLVAVRSFLRKWKIPLDVELPRHACVIYHNRDLSKEIIRQILSRASQRDRTIWLFMAESGLRAKTTINLKYLQIQNDFEKEIVPMRILTPAETLKDHVGDRWSFVGEDSVRALREYLKPRMPLKGEDYVFASERPGRVKGEQYSESALSVKFSRTCRALKLEKGTPYGKPGRYRMHGLRKYFRNNCRADPFYREFWMGHDIGIDESYIDRTMSRDLTDPEIHRKLYQQAYEELRILEPTTPTGYREIQQQLKQRDSEIQELRAEMQKLREDSEATDQAMEHLFKDTGILEKSKKELLEYLIKTLNQMGKEDRSKEGKEEKTKGE